MIGDILKVDSLDFCDRFHIFREEYKKGKIFSILGAGFFQKKKDNLAIVLLFFRSKKNYKTSIQFKSWKDFSKRRDKDSSDKRNQTRGS